MISSWLIAVCVVLGTGLVVLVTLCVVVGAFCLYRSKKAKKALTKHTRGSLKYSENAESVKLVKNHPSPQSSLSPKRRQRVSLSLLAQHPSSSTTASQVDLVIGSSHVTTGYKSHENHVTGHVTNSRDHVTVQGGHVTNSDKSCGIHMTPQNNHVTTQTSSQESGTTSSSPSHILQAHGGYFQTNPSRILHSSELPSRGLKNTPHIHRTTFQAPQVAQRPSMPTSTTTMSVYNIRTLQHTHTPYTPTPYSPTRRTSTASGPTGTSERTSRTSHRHSSTSAMSFTRAGTSMTCDSQ